MPQIEMQHVTKYFTNEQRRFTAIDDVSLTIERGEFVFLIGSSGAGKTTLLRLLANQIVADEGKIWIDDVELTRLRGWRRPGIPPGIIGQVWQDASLIRKKTVRQNLELVQRALGVKSKVIPENTRKALSIVGMRAMEDRYPF